MVAAERAITIELGVTFKEVRTLKVADPLFPDDRTKDTLMNLTGYSGRSQVRDLKGLGEIIVTFTVTVDPVLSTVTREITSAVSTLIDPNLKRCRHDLEIYTLNDLDVIRLETGDVVFSKEVTKP